ncbi:hypothetical protein BXY66_1952 [Shimia isoporae]|uniref:Oxidoreductase molybdopterin-binding domain-containing protein n=1 Tax=Shimia isoporae TaxID=647720 RepID=A0A4R1NN75_9RHOB|nr:oxidoreductase [Shimia isoporae]TCL09887.1 hypothetical protein BXY66_1952 [Shimia isoporae]
MFKRTLGTLLTAATLCLSTTAWAAPLASPENEVILTVSGELAQVNAGGTAQFDLAMIKGLPAVELVTETIWTEGSQTFVGTPLHEITTALGVEAGTLKAYAVNDYAVEIPVTDAVEGGPIVAYLHNGAEMSLRDKGPLWIIYPYDTNPSYKSETYYSRSIWQLDRIEVIPAQ